MPFMSSKRSFAESPEPSARVKMRELVSHARRLVQAVATVDEAELLGRVARYDYEIGDYKTARLGHEREVAALKAVLGNRDPRTLHAMGTTRRHPADRG